MRSVAATETSHVVAMSQCWTGAPRWCRVIVERLFGASSRYQVPKHEEDIGATLSRCLLAKE